MRETKRRHLTAGDDPSFTTTPRPLAGYIGGKWFLRTTICPIIDATPHACYVEPFLGMGSIFLGRASRPRVEVVNDRNDEIANLFRVVQRHPSALAEAIRYAITSRSEYARHRRIDPSTLTDVERAARFLLLRKLTFSAKDDYAAGFGTSNRTAKVFDAGEIARRIDALHRRLDRVVIENLDFADCLARYDGSATFFYLDPPYHGHTHLYRDGGFRQADFGRLAESLRGLEGGWLMSLNDRPQVRELFAWARIRTVETRYNAQVGRGSQRISELLIAKPRRRGRG